MIFYVGKVLGNVVLIFENVVIGYEGVFLLELIDLDVKKFDVIVIVGLNGIGKLILIKLFVG